MSAIAPVGLTPDQLMARANEILRETTKIKTPYHILGPREIEVASITFANAKENAAKFPPGKYKEHVALHKTIAHTRMVCQVAADMALSDKSEEYRNLIMHKVVTCFGVGLCAETTASSFLLAYQLNLKAMRVFAFNPENPTENHAFTIIEPKTDLRIVSENLLELLNNLDQGIIIDPFLKLVLKAQNFRDKNKGKDLKEYLQKHKVTQIHEVLLPQPTISKEVKSSLEKDIATVKELAAQIFKSDDTKSDPLLSEFDRILKVLDEPKCPSDAQNTPLSTPSTAGK